MNNICKCGGPMIPYKEDRKAFTWICLWCSDKITQRKRKAKQPVIVIVSNDELGVDAVGPFTSEEKADNWVETHQLMGSLKCKYIITYLVKP